MDRIEKFRLLKTCLDHLTPERGRLLALAYVSGLSDREICEALGISRSRFGRELEQAHAELKSHLECAGVRADVAGICAEDLLRAYDSDPNVPYQLKRKILSEVNASETLCEKLGVGHSA